MGSTFWLTAKGGTPRLVGIFDYLSNDFFHRVESMNVLLSVYHSTNDLRPVRHEGGSTSLMKLSARKINKLLPKMLNYSINNKKIFI